MYSYASIIKLVFLYLAAREGRLVPGFLHNINNSLHLLKMNFSLLDRDLSSPKSEKRLQACKNVIKQFDKLNKIAGDRQFYVNESVQQIYINDFISWLVAYWKNDSFCKHRVELDVGGDGLYNTITIAPYVLTFCLEEGLINSLEELKDKDGLFNITFKVTIIDNKVVFELSSPTELKTDKPFMPFLTTKDGHLGFGLYLTQELIKHWDGEVKLYSKESQTIFQISLPLISKQE
ncbi:MAG: hypothetical protein Q9M37_06875 [Desulfonauticus sp.]|nr:hypothetical protein [Desulfonauticus sp.]